MRAHVCGLSCFIGLDPGVMEKIKTIMHGK